MKELTIRVGARASPLSRKQVAEVLGELKRFHPSVQFEVSWVQTLGDKDQQTSLRQLEKTDFFTREIDELLLRKDIAVGIHSAKDLPEPLPPFLKRIALTRGVDSSDSLVLRPGTNLEDLPKGALIATSSERREEMVKALRPDLSFTDIRGPIHERLKRLEEGDVDGVVIAEAAIIRLELMHLSRIKLPGETSLHQGRLAIVAREDDFAMEKIFKCLDGN